MAFFDPPMHWDRISIIAKLPVAMYMVFTHVKQKTSHVSEYFNDIISWEFPELKWTTFDS